MAQQNQQYCLAVCLEAPGPLWLLTALDHQALSRYCVLYARWRDAEQFLAENGMTYERKDPDGNVIGLKEWPQVSRASQLADQLLKLEQQFGMTPSARTRLSVNIDADQDKDKWPSLEAFRLH